MQYEERKLIHIKQKQAPRDMMWMHFKIQIWMHLKLLKYELLQKITAILKRDTSKEQRPFWQKTRIILW